MLDDSDDKQVVGRLGSYLAKTKRAGLNLAPGFVVPINKHVGYGLSNAILRKADEMDLDQVILRASPTDDGDFESIFPVARDRIIANIEYMQRNAERAVTPSAIIVQEFLDGEVCGKIYSLNPYTGDEHEILVEARLWANNSVLGDDDEPEMLLVNKKDGAVSLESDDEAQNLEPEQVQELYLAVRKLEKRLDEAICLDWAFVDGVLYILNTRPIK